MTAFTELARVEHPIVQAPMAGGPTTVELVAAVSEAGALGSIAGAMLAPDALREEIRAVRALTDRPFAVNLFAPLDPPTLDAERAAAVRELLEPHRRRLGLGEARAPAARDWTVADQIEVVAGERVAAFSFTFGIPPLDGLGDTLLLGTATTAQEAAALEQAGAHAVVLQGAEAGGHRGTFLTSFDEGRVALAELVPASRAACSLPIVAAGGLMTGADVAAAMEIGADAAQLGTAFLFCPESGAGPDWTGALRERETTITAAYTGRPARGALTDFLAELMTLEPVDYPLQAALIADLRGHAGYGFYLGGTGARRARALPASELVATIASELRQIR